MTDDDTAQAQVAISPGQLWAKCERGGERWHALPFHSLDVAATADCLWQSLSDASVAPIAASVGGVDAAKRLCVFLAASHDVGKANKYFQAKDWRQVQRLESCGISLPSRDVVEPKRHGHATGTHLTSWLTDTWHWSSFAAKMVALAVGGHHGTFFRDTERSPLGLGNDEWWRAGQALLDQLSDLIAPATPQSPTPLNPFLGWIAGFVSVADWLGSHEMMTVWQTADQDSHSYMEQARERASRLFHHLGWKSATSSTRLAVQNLVPKGATPNHLQKLGEQVSSDFSFALVEAPTGVGKTEAAFALAEFGRSQGAGVYFGLPTMATANGLQSRVQAYLFASIGDSEAVARLLHSQSWLFRDRTATVRDPDEEGDEQDTRAYDWFSGSKRGLLAPYGVGTIDQALIAALRAKHGFVRLFALAGKVVVLDEIHAYDVYMSDLIEVLLGWLKALGCKVVMLSATLPRRRREELMRAWGFEGDMPQTNYPCLTWVGGDGSARTTVIEVAPRKPVAMRLHECANEPWLSGAELIRSRVRASGGHGALILNTVNDAQLAFQWLKDQEVGNIEVSLFHARFTAQDRDGIERRVLARYGKEGARIGSSILVATQVVEQSLDLDFDHMVSALSPIDLLIQRAGRLHRHARDERGSLLEHDAEDERPNPYLSVLSPPLESVVDSGLTDPVYQHDVLLRTLAAIGAGLDIGSSLSIEDAIESVYSEEGRVKVMESWAKKLEEFEERTMAQAQDHRRKAECASIATVDDPDRLLVEANIDLDENDERHSSQLAARTRLEDRPSVTLALLRDGGTTLSGDSTADLRAGFLGCVCCSPPFPLWKELIALAPLAIWQRKGGLAHARPLTMPDGYCTVGTYDVIYDSIMGLRWRKTVADF